MAEKSAMKRLNRLRKLARDVDVADYLGTNLNQNWKAIEDTFSYLDKAMLALSSAGGASIKLHLGTLTGAYSNSTTSPITIGEVNFTSTRPSFAVIMIGSPTTAQAQPSFLAAVSKDCQIQCGSQNFYLSSGMTVGSHFFIDPVPASGSRSYQLSGMVTAAGGQLLVSYSQLFALEIAI